MQDLSAGVTGEDALTIVRALPSGDVHFLPCIQAILVPSTEKTRRGGAERFVKPIIDCENDARVCLLLMDQPNRGRHVRRSPMGHALVGSSVVRSPDD